MDVCLLVRTCVLLTDVHAPSHQSDMTAPGVSPSVLSILPLYSAQYFFFFAKTIQYFLFVSHLGGCIFPQLHLTPAESSNSPFPFSSLGDNALAH